MSSRVEPVVYRSPVKTYAARLMHAMQAKAIKPAEMNRLLELSHGAMHHAKKAAETGGEYELKGPKSAQAARLLGVRHEWLALGEEPMHEDGREALSPRAVYIGELYDRLEGQAARDRAYAMLIQLLDFEAARMHGFAPAE